MSADYQVQHDVAIITLSNPPVNGLGHATRVAFMRGLEQALADPKVVAVVWIGYDEPRISCILMARPTQSRVLWTQAVGRGTRRHPGKERLLLYDFADVGLASNVTLNRDSTDRFRQRASRG